MNAKIILPIFAVFLLVLLQTSFFAHFGFLNNRWIQSVNAVLILAAAISLFEKRTGNTGIAAAVLGGMLLDIYSEKFFGFWTLILLSLVLLIKFFIKKYVRIPSLW